MTNPYPTGGSYSPFGNNRRSSYASVAAGAGAGAGAGAASTATPHSPNSRSSAGTLSQLLRSEQMDRLRERERSSLHDNSPSAPPNMPSAKGGIEKTWPTFGQSNHSLPDDIPSPSPELICPSYLRSSRYLQRLAEEHSAASTVVKDKDSNRPGRHVYYNNDTQPPAPPAASPIAANLNRSSSSLSSHGRASVQDHIERLPPLETEPHLRKLPSSWSETDKCVGLDILNGGTEVKFSGATKTSDEAAAIRSDHPIPKEVGLYYFEVTILSRGKEGLIGIGFSSPKANLNRLPGWEPDSWAYHGDDGYSFACTASGKAYGPKFSSLDVIGCGVNFRTNSAFFTKNGQYIGEAFHNIKADKLHPSVGMKKLGEHLRVNFGATPFVFDIDAMMESERTSVGEEIRRTSTSVIEPPLEERALIQELIAQYLTHDGYVETARAFAADVHTQRESLSGDSEPLKTFDPSQDIHGVNRQKIRVAILAGEIDTALKYITTYYPHVLDREENRDVYFKLRRRKFVEMIRSSNEVETSPSAIMTAKGFGKLAQKSGTLKGLDQQMEVDDHFHSGSQAPTLPPVNMPAPLDPNVYSSGDGIAGDTMDTSPDLLKPTPSIKSNLPQTSSLLRDALAYGKELNREFGSDPRPSIKKELQDTYALVAYSDARDSSVGWLLDTKRRVEIAEEVNAAILVSLGKPSYAALETLCAQTEVLLDMLSAEGGPGAFVNVKDCLQ